jgi:hypothetical protein
LLPGEGAAERGCDFQGRCLDVLQSHLSDTGLRTRWQFLHFVPERMMPPISRKQYLLAGAPLVHSRKKPAPQCRVRHGGTKKNAKTNVA